MATVQTDGTTSVTTTSTVNNGGVMTANGTSAANVLRSQPTATAQAGVYSNVVVDGDNADEALSAGTFAYNNQTPTAVKVTTSLAGTSNTFLRSGANDSNNRSINKLEVITTQRITSAIRDNKYNRYTGAWDSGYPVNAVDEFWDIAAATGSNVSTDDAAAPSQSVPGELTYMNGSRYAVNDDYKAKTSW